MVEAQHCEVEAGYGEHCRLCLAVRADHGEQPLVGRHRGLEAVGCGIGERGAWVSRTGLVQICEWTFDWSSIENLV